MHVLDVLKKWLPNHQYLCCNLGHIVNENISAVHSSYLFEKIGCAFIVIEPETELSFSFSNIGSIIINLASQKVKSFSWVTITGPTLSFEYLPKWFFCNNVRSNYAFYKFDKYSSHRFTASNITYFLESLVSLGSP